MRYGGFFFFCHFLVIVSESIGSMWAPKHFCLSGCVLTSRALDTMAARPNVNHRVAGVKHMQMAAAFEWRLCATVTVSLLIMVEMIHFLGGDINQVVKKSPSFLYLEFLALNICSICT